MPGPPPAYPHFYYASPAFPYLGLQLVQHSCYLAPCFLTHLVSPALCLASCGRTGLGSILLLYDLSQVPSLMALYSGMAQGSGLVSVKDSVKDSVRCWACDTGVTVSFDVGQAGLKFQPYKLQHKWSHM